MHISRSDVSIHVFVDRAMLAQRDFKIQHARSENEPLHETYNISQKHLTDASKKRSNKNASHKTHAQKHGMYLLLSPALYSKKTTN